MGGLAEVASRDKLLSPWREGLSNTRTDGRKRQAVYLKDGRDPGNYCLVRELVRSHGASVTSVQVPYRYLGSIASEENNAKNEEYIIIATP